MNRLVIGMGMVPRGEVGLIFAGVGSSLMLDGAPIISPGVFSAIVLMVLTTTLLAPVGLRWAFRRTNPGFQAGGGRKEAGFRTCRCVESA